MKKSPTSKVKKEEPSAVKYMNQDVDRMTFETEMRYMMRELIEPVIIKTKNDREMILRLQRSEDEFYSRLDFLEKSVYKKDPETGATLFDQVEEKILQMDIEIKAHMQGFKEQVKITEQKCDDEVFKQNQRLLKIENYDKMIELNRKATENLQQQIENTVVQIRGMVDLESQSNKIEFNLQHEKIHQLKTMCDKLPPLVQLCESKVISMEDKCKTLGEKVDDTIIKSIDIQESKWSVKQQKNFQYKLDNIIFAIENGIDKGAEHCSSLQNWIDIYLPMRLQHQITETMKECLPRRGKYLLGVIDLQMQSQLRERMFADINHPDLKRRCLDVIDQLKLEADILIEENIKKIQGAAESWNVTEIQEKKNEINEKKNKVLEETVLPKLERKGGGGGDADSEAMALMQEQLEQFCLDECQKLEKKFSSNLTQFQTTTIKQLEDLDNNINFMSNQSSAFINAIKDELDHFTFTQKKQNIDTYSIIKDLSSTIKKIMERQNGIMDDCGKMRHTLSLTVQQQQIISTFMNLKLSAESNLASEGESSTQLQLTQQVSVTNIQKNLVLGSKMNSTQGHLHKMDSSVQNNNQFAKIMHEANENMKKLSVSLFRANFKKDKKLPENIQPLISDRNKTNGSMVDLIEIEEDEEVETFDTVIPYKGKMQSINLMKQKYTTPSVGPTLSHENQTPIYPAHYEEPNFQNLMQMIIHDKSKSRDIEDATSLNDLNKKLNMKLNTQIHTEFTESPVEKMRAAEIFQQPKMSVKVNNNSLLSSQKKSQTFRNNAMSTMTTSKKINRMVMPMTQDAGTNVAQSFDFGALDGNLRYMKRGSMPNGAQPVLAQVLPKPPVTSWKNSTGQSGKNIPMGGSSSGAMYQSFGFGPLQVQRAKYGSQEKMPKGIAGFSMDYQGASDHDLLPQIQ